MTQLVDLKRALISVSDKTGLLELGKALADRGVELLSTGGSAKVLRDARLPVTDVADVTGFPEMMDGRVRPCILMCMVGYWPCATILSIWLQCKNMG